MAIRDSNNTGELPPYMQGTPQQTPADARRQMLTDPVTGQPVQSFMGGPAMQRMIAAQAAGGTGRAPMPGGGGLGSLPMLRMLAPYLSQGQGGMSPLLAQLLPMLAQQRLAGSPVGGMADAFGGLASKTPQAAMMTGGVQAPPKNTGMGFNMYPTMMRR